jgi:allophanate hydrolase
MSPTAVPSPEKIDEFADIAGRASAYRSGRDAARDLEATYERIAAFGERPAFISLMPFDQARAILAAAEVRRTAGAELPLFGIPFAVKDNIDVAGLPTTAACPGFAYVPKHSAYAVQRLVDAGAIPIGKANLDQFATGLNGTRSPYGIPTCVFDNRYVSGGSSSGSAVAVAAGLVPFALGTDTAGSGRVPAAFNNLVGLKPTKGLVSTSGIVPACRSQDCVSVFASNVADALAVACVMAGFDADDAFSRAAPEQVLFAKPMPHFRFGMPSPEVLAVCSESVADGIEDAALALEQLGGQRVAIDFTAFQEAAALLYTGPWVAERLAAVRTLDIDQLDGMNAVVRDIILSGKNYSAADVFEAQYRLAALVRQAEAEWARMDVLLLPTTPDHPTVAEMLTDPVGRNARLGLFTNFVNLMDLAAIAVPAGFDRNGLPIGVTLIGPAFSDGKLAHLGDRLQRSIAGARLGGSGLPLSASSPVEENAGTSSLLLAVVGAHLTGQPLNHQLTSRGGCLVATGRTGSGYSLYALANTTPPKPGLVRDGGKGGIEVEIWSLPPEGFGAFVAEIPAPLGIGKLTLEDGSAVQGFLCESHAISGARDITHFGSWRAFLGSASQAA